MKKFFLTQLLLGFSLIGITAQADTNYNYVGDAGSIPVPPILAPPSNVWNNVLNWKDNLGQGSYEPSANVNGCSFCNYYFNGPVYPGTVDGFPNPAMILSDNLIASSVSNKSSNIFDLSDLGSGATLTLAPSAASGLEGTMVGDWSVDVPIIISSNDVQFPVVINGSISLTQNSSLSLGGHDLTLSDQSSLSLHNSITFQSNTLTFAFSGDYLANLNGQIPLNVINSSGVISPTQCKTMICDSTPANQTYDLYLENENNSLFLVVGTQTAVFSHPLKNIQIASFPNGFGSYNAVHGVGVDNFGCCYNSPGLDTNANFLTGAVSFFDPIANPIANQGSSSNFVFKNSAQSPYHLVWSDYTSVEYNPDLYFSSDLGYSNYGVNGVFGFWVDVVQNHHTPVPTAGTNSPNHTATMLNTLKKSNQMQLVTEIVLDETDLTELSDKVAFSDVLETQKSLLAQQSMVQQLAERNLRTPVKHWGVYVEPRGSWGQIYNQKGQHGNTFQTAGTRAGVDYLWVNEKSAVPVCVGLGFVADYLHLWGQKNHHSGNFFANEGLGNVYLTVVPKAVRELSFNLIGGGGYSWYTFHRDVFEDSSIMATGKTSGPEADLFFEIEYVFRHKQFSKIPKDFKIAPIASLQYTYSKIDSYKESGAGRYNLKVNAQDASTLSTLIGFRTNYEFRAKSDVSVRPELMLLWQYQYLDPSITSTSSYVIPQIGPDIITSIIPGMPRNTLIVGADLRINIYECAEVQLDYDLLYNSGFITNVFFLELKGKF